VARVDEVVVARVLDNLLVKLGEAYGYLDFVRCISAAKLGSLCKMMKAHGAMANQRARLVGARPQRVVDLNAGKPKFMPHDAKYPFRDSSETTFDAKATCRSF